MQPICTWLIIYSCYFVSFCHLLSYLQHDDQQREVLRFAIQEIFRVVCRRKARVGWMIGPITGSPIFGQ